MKRIPGLIIVFLTVLAAAGCVNLLEDDVESILPHVSAPYVRPPKEQIIVSDYDELSAAIFRLVNEHETSAELHYYSYDDEDAIYAEILHVRNTIINNSPIGAYAVADITADAIKIVSYYEIEIEIEYKRTKEQLDSIINVSTQRYLMTELLNVMSDHREETVIRTNLNITEDIITEIVREVYYQNPRRVVMLPYVAVETFPEEGRDRIYEIRFGYSESPRMLQRYSETLASYVRRNAELAVGETDAEILHSLVSNLMESANFDVGTARTIVHGAQNFTATAFGALVNGSAVGEGFAMAFKALCDELRFDCRIVLGFLDGRVHAWNIVFLSGDYYHIDVSMCDLNGIETAFLKSDDDFTEMYTWDREDTVKCEGELTYEELFGPEETDDPEDPDDPDNAYDPDEETTEPPEDQNEQNSTDEPDD